MSAWNMSKEQSYNKLLRFTETVNILYTAYTTKDRHHKTHTHSHTDRHTEIQIHTSREIQKTRKLLTSLETKRTTTKLRNLKMRKRERESQSRNMLFYSSQHHIDYRHTYTLSETQPTHQHRKQTRRQWHTMGLSSHKD